MSYHRGGHPGAVAVSYSTSSMSPLSPTRRYTGSGAGSGAGSTVGGSTGVTSGNVNGNATSKYSTAFHRSSTPSSGYRNSTTSSYAASSTTESTYRRNYYSPARSVSSYNEPSSSALSSASSITNGLGSTRYGSTSCSGSSGSSTASSNSTSSCGTLIRDRPRPVAPSSLTTAADIYAIYSPANYVPNIHGIKSNNWSKSSSSLSSLSPHSTSNTTTTTSSSGISSGSTTSEAPRGKEDFESGRQRTYSGDSGIGIVGSNRYQNSGGVVGGGVSSERWRRDPKRRTTPVIGIGGGGGGVITLTGNGENSDGGAAPVEVKAKKNVENEKCEVARAVEGSIIRVEQVKENNAPRNGIRANSRTNTVVNGDDNKTLSSKGRAAREKLSEPGEKRIISEDLVATDDNKSSGGRLKDRRQLSTRDPRLAETRSIIDNNNTTNGLDDLGEPGRSHLVIGSNDPDDLDPSPADRETLEPRTNGASSGDVVLVAGQGQGDLGPTVTTSVNLLLAADIGITLTDESDDTRTNRVTDSIHDRRILDDDDNNRDNNNTRRDNEAHLFADCRLNNTLHLHFDNHPHHQPHPHKNHAKPRQHRQHQSPEALSDRHDRTRSPGDLDPLEPHFSRFQPSKPTLTDENAPETPSPASSSDKSHGDSPLGAKEPLTLTLIPWAETYDRGGASGGAAGDPRPLDAAGGDADHHRRAAYAWTKLPPTNPDNTDPLTNNNVQNREVSLGIVDEGDLETGRIRNGEQLPVGSDDKAFSIKANSVIQDRMMLSVLGTNSGLHGAKKTSKKVDAMTKKAENGDEDNVDFSLGPKISTNIDFEGEVTNGFDKNLDDSSRIFNGDEETKNRQNKSDALELTLKNAASNRSDETGRASSNSRKTLFGWDDQTIDDLTGPSSVSNAAAGSSSAPSNINNSIPVGVHHGAHHPRGTSDQIDESSNSRTGRSRLSSRRDEHYGLNGLRNIGNTCFMNSVIQCLSNTRPLLEYLLNEQHLQDINTTTSSMKGALIKAFGQVIQELWEMSGDHVVNTAALKSQIQRFAPRFMGYSQQDAQEFLRYLLEGLHEDVNRVTVKPQPILTDIPDHYSDSHKASESWKRYLRSEDSTIVDVFVGQLRSSLHCTSCDHVSVTLDPFWDLSLPIPSRSGTVKLNQCLEHFTKVETLDGDEKPTCSKCQMRRKCTKSFSIQKFPKILVIHLKRFSPIERFRGKLSVLVDFPLTSLDLSAFAAPGVQGPTYNLYGVANHSGTTYSGHYTAYCKHPYSGEWHEYNDSRVSSVPGRSVVSSEAYVLFYEQQQSQQQANNPYL